MKNIIYSSLFTNHYSLLTILCLLITVNCSLFTAHAQQRGFKEINVNIDGSTTKLYTQSHALVIGVSQYSAGWPVLPGVNKDITAVKAALENNDFNVTLVLNPTKSEMDKAFSDFITKYGQQNENRLLFYFAGHGHTIKMSYGDELGYIVPADAPNPNTDQPGFLSKAIAMQRIEEYAKSIQSKHALFLFDACFSGSLFALSRAVPDVITYKTANPVRQFITSGSANETVPDKSVFSEQFISAITTGDADANKDGYITGTELGEFLENTVINYTNNSQHPQYGKIRNANLDKGDFVFVLPSNISNNTRQNTSVKPVVVTEEKQVLYGSIEINTTLAGSLYIDDAFVKRISAIPAGQSMVFTLSNIVTGKHTIKIEGPEKWEQLANVYKGQKTVLNVNPAKGPVVSEASNMQPNTGNTSKPAATIIKPADASKDPDCNTKSTGDYCFVNNTKFELQVTLRSSADVPRTCIIKPGGQNSFYDIESGSATYFIKEYLGLGVRRVSFGAYKSGEEPPCNCFKDANGTLYVEKCKTKIFNITQ